jgi:hypothetical protein
LVTSLALPEKAVSTGRGGGDEHIEEHDAACFGGACHVLPPAASAKPRNAAKKGSSLPIDRPDQAAKHPTERANRDPPAEH